MFISTNIGRLCVPNRFVSDNVLAEFYTWFSEIVIFVFPFVTLLTINSVIIHALRKRSKQNLMGSESQGQTEGQNIKGKHPEKQIMTMLLVVTFVYLILLILTRSVVLYINFYNDTTPYYYAGLHLFYQIGEKSFYTNHGINFFLYVISGQKFRKDLKNLFFKKILINNQLMSIIKTSSITSTENNFNPHTP